LAYKNFKKHDITHINRNKFSSNLYCNLLYSTLRTKQRFRVAYDNSGYRSIKSNAINNHGGITRSTTSTHKGRRGNVRRTLNANANVRVFPVNHLHFPIFASRKFYAPIVMTSLFLVVSSFAFHRPAITFPLAVSRWIDCEKDRGAFYPCSKHLSRTLGVEVSTALLWQIAKLPTLELLAFSAAFTVCSFIWNDDEKSQ